MLTGVDVTSERQNRAEIRREEGERSRAVAQGQGVGASSGFAGTTT